MDKSAMAPELRDSVAIIGMAGRFPGARNIAEFWRNQLNGVESISRFRPEDFVDRPELGGKSNFVPARSVLEDVDLFDAEFFGIHPREAKLMDPQHRIFLECCWEALENGGYDPFSYGGSIGVFAGCSMPSYFLASLCSQPGFIERFTHGYQVGNYHEMLGNSQDFLATRVSYKLNLRGPSFTLQAGCSTSLVAVCQGCQSLLTYQADMVLAGGVSITLPQKRGWYYQEGGMISPDGHCRAFDAQANGTVFGSGAGVVLLKRFEDAVRDGDYIYAVIRGFALNNDGSSKVGYTAPSVEGQARVIQMAQAMAGIDPATIGYIEAHGTGTPMGDPIELAALNKTFREKTEAKQFCVIGTAKTNVGHLDVAAGVTGLIHAVNIVRDAVFPPTLHFQAPNPQFNLQESPFYVNARRKPWDKQQTPRRAGVSAFGVGGTNAHVVLEEPPQPESQPNIRPAELLVLSARTEKALDKACESLSEYLGEHPHVSLGDVAWTLQTGRRRFAKSSFVVATDVSDAISRLSKDRSGTRATASDDAPSVYFSFPGQGSQHVHMGRGIYEVEPFFREGVDSCCEILHDQLGEDLRTLLFPSDADDQASTRINETQFAQPALFTIEYALAKLWMHWGVHPQAMIGHSVGEFVTACLAGVFSLEDALRVVATRGRMMQELPRGGMLSVRLPESEVRARLNGQGQLAVAAVNSPSLCVLAGDLEEVERFESELKADSVPCRQLTTSHAFHSPMMEPILDAFARCVSETHLNVPKIPFISCVTGTWIRESEATDPAYWSRHLRAPVQFSAGIKELKSKNGNAVLLEVGPGSTLTSLARHNLEYLEDRTAEASARIRPLASLSSPNAASEFAALLTAAGSLWSAGLSLNWPEVNGGDRRSRLPLPTYPFKRKRFWLTPSATSPGVNHESASSASIDTLRPQFPVQETQQVKTSAQTASRVPQADEFRQSKIISIISDIFADLSGVQLSDPAATFLELGFDSLFLTQVTQSIQSRFGVKITFRQLLGDQSTLSSLADFVAANLPANSPFLVDDGANVWQQQEHVVADLQSSASTASVDSARKQRTEALLPHTSHSSLEQLMRDQLAAMNDLIARQLDAVRSLAASPVTASDIATSGQEVSRTPSTSPQHAPASQQDSREFKPFGPYKPPQSQKGSPGTLSKQQEDYLQALIKRITERTVKSKSLTQTYRKHLADPRVVSGFRPQWKEIVYPIITERSKGSRLWDIDGNEYIDILNGFGPIMLGHRPDFVEQAVEQQLHDGFEIGPQTRLAGEIAEAFCRITGNERMTFCNTGSEAVIAALRVARTVTGRNKVVVFAGAYHGMFDEVLVKAVKGGDGPRSLPIAPGIPREAVGNVVVLDFGSDESLAWIRAHANELAAVLTEPVQSRHPSLQPVEFLREIRKITEGSDTALIFDEVVTGFRAHPGGCQALFDIRADLATYGKVLAGGMPIGVLAGKSQYMDALDGGSWQFGDESYPSAGVTFFAGTFVRHPLALAAVKAVLSHFEEQGPKLQENLAARTASLVTSLNNLFNRYGVPSHIETFASIFYFSMPAESPLASLLYYHLREKGVYILEGFPCFLTTAHSEADIQKVISAFDDSLSEMAAAGIFHATAAPEIAQPALASESVPGIKPEEADPKISEVPLTEAQLEVWLSAQLGDDASCAFNESFTLLLNGELNLDVIRESFQAVIQRHEALRATIVPDRNVMRFASQISLGLPVTDLSGLRPTERQAKLDEAKRVEASTPFDLVNGPTVRARLFRLEPTVHALIFTAHHIFCDGWSANLLLDQLASLYNAGASGTLANLSPAAQFSDYAGRPPVQDDSEAYWLDQFRTAPPSLELPTDRPRPAVKSFKGATHRTRIDVETCREIKKTGAKHGCTLFSMLLAGFAALLHRLTSQTDIVIGIPAAGQSLLENGNLIGHCVNFLPIRLGVPGNESVGDFLKKVRQSVFDAYDHQSYTYGTLVRKLHLRRDPSRLPLVEVQFNLEKVGSKLEFAELKTEVDPNPKAAVNFDLFLNIVESDKGLLLDCDYNTDLFDRDTIARWLGYFETLLKAISENAGESVDRLRILSESERQLLLQDWNNTSREYPRHKAVHQLIEEQASRSPQSVAARCNQQALTYCELDRRSNQLAHHLIKIGVTPGSLVGIAVNRSPDLLVALLAIWKAGAAYVPLDPAYPRERLSFILREARLSTLVTESSLVSDLPVEDTRLVCVDRDAILFAREPMASPELAPDPEANAYVIFTSGSTGTPKGVEVTHRNLANLLWSMRERPGLRSSDRLLAVTTLSFDIAALELFLPLITGAQVILATRESASDPRLLIRLLNDGESLPTVMQATPATWRMLMDSGWSSGAPIKLLCGGEALPRQLANALAQNGELWNMYGPTETTVWSAVSQVELGDLPVAIGLPIANTTFYVLSEAQELAPIGVPGELYIGGDGVARGYHNNPQLTSERFIPDPFSQVADARLYRTGDLVRRLPDGSLEFLGRLDDQVKIRGFRIELGEIETVLSRHAAIRQCVVAAQEAEPGIKRLVGYCVPEQPNACSPDELRDWVGRFLPDYMVPSVFIFLPTLPQTPNGKVDRKALPNLDALDLPKQALFVGPRTPVEAQLAKVVTEVLHVDRVSVHDSLFDIGADSIHLFQIIARASASGLVLSPQQVLRLRSIAAIANELESGVISNSQSKPRAISPVSREQYQLNATAQSR